MRKAALFVMVTAVMFSCGGRGASKKNTVAGGTSTASVQNTEVKRYTYEVEAVYPHDRKAYTQGLFWHEGYLYEGTGQNGLSDLRKVELETGKVLQKADMERRYFGEGITYHDSKIYQLTWTAGRAFVYDAETFRQLRTFSYDGEGWGITSDGMKLYMSDGSETIYIRNPETFNIESTIEVRQNGRPVDMLNELEWIDGKIWANRYLYEEIVIIEPSDGSVVGVIDFRGIHAPEDRRLPGTDVFNGIAYDEHTGRIYVTGKNWNKLYQIKIVEDNPL